MCFAIAADNLLLSTDLAAFCGLLLDLPEPLPAELFCHTKHFTTLPLTVKSCFANLASVADDDRAQGENKMERFFILTPTKTDRLAPNSQGDLFPVYLDASGSEMKWSGKGELPAIGERVYMAINSIGYGTVKGYCESHGFLGLLVLPENPPEWYRKQVKQHVDETIKARRIGPEKAKIERLREWPSWICEGIACVFGAEVRS